MLKLQEQGLLLISFAVSDNPNLPRYASGQHGIGRAPLRFLEVAQVQTFSCTDKPIFSLYMNERNRRVIDFNPAIWKEFSRLAFTMFPARSPHVVRAEGEIFAQSAFRMLKAWVPRTNSKTHDDIMVVNVHEFLEEANDVPAFWLGDGSDRMLSPT